MTNEETDTALILENELKRRVKEIVEPLVVDMVRRIIREELSKNKTEMMLEVAISVGKMLRLVEQEDRKPLWEATPEEFGMTQQDLNTHALGRKEGYNHPKLDNAIGTI